MGRPSKVIERRAQLVDAAIAEIGEGGTLDVTVASIARRAGVSPALAHHYFGSKDSMFLAAMRHILGAYGAEVRAGLACARTARDRVDAIVAGSFSPANFAPSTVSAWLNFYVAAQTSPEAARLLRVYASRLRSNLRHALCPVMPPSQAADAADQVAALIDGFYIRQALNDDRLTPDRIRRLIAAHLDTVLGKATPT